jgi:glycosyltransferase involved in cell wall biosynthesis
LKYNLKKIGYRLALSSGVKNARRIITPSQFVKNSITEHFGNKYGEKINITYEGINEELLGADENVDLSKKFQKPFFIYVGNFYPHKNVEKLMKAFSQLDIKYSLILIGPDDYFAKRAHQLLSHLQTKNIIFCHNPSLEDFVYFYKNATALIHPSLTEGFGLPLIEASYFSCPIIASDIPVFSEVLGSNYLSFNPHSVEDIQKKIKLFIEKLNDSSMQNFFLSKNQIVREFTFKKMAEQTMRIYQIAL